MRHERLLHLHGLEHHDEVSPVHPTVTDAESVELRWVPVDEVADLPLLPAFASAWPHLRERLVALGCR